MKRLNIYLAGACKGLVDEGTSWRNEAFERFILAQKYLEYAVDKGIPVIGFGKQNVYEWLPEDCDVVFDTLEEAVDYIINYYD